MRTLARTLFPLGIVLALAGCSKPGPEDSSLPTGATDSTPPGTTTTPTEQVTVSVSPTTADVRVDESQDFQATVTGTTEPSVSWSVDGSGDLGTIDANGRYTAPSTVPDPPDVTVRATSTADPSVSATATVTVLPPLDIPVETWAWQGGGSSSEHAYATRPVGSQGFVVAAGTASVGEGNMDGWLLRFDVDGTLLWQTVAGETQNQMFIDVVPMPSGGFLAVGERTDPTTLKREVWLVELDGSGAVLAEQSFGHAAWDYKVSEARALSDGRIALVGSASGGASGLAAAFVFLLDASGQPVSEQLYGVGDLNAIEAYDFVERAAGGLALAGSAWTAATSANQQDMWLMLLDANLDPVISMAYGGTGIDQAQGVAETATGYVIAGTTWSFGAGNMDGWMVATDASGAIQWQNTYGASSRDGLNNVAVLANGNLVAAGEQSSGIAGWVVQIDGTGALLGETPMYAEPFDIEPVAAGGTVVTGYRNAGSYEAVVVRLDEAADLTNCTLSSTGTVQAIPTSVAAVALTPTRPAVEGAWHTPSSTVTVSTNTGILVCGP